MEREVSLNGREREDSLVVRASNSETTELIKVEEQPLDAVYSLGEGKRDDGPWRPCWAQDEEGIRPFLLPTCEELQRRRRSGDLGRSDEDHRENELLARRKEEGRGRKRRTNSFEETKLVSDDDLAVLRDVGRSCSVELDRTVNGSEAKRRSKSERARKQSSETKEGETY